MPQNDPNFSISPNKQHDIPENGQIVLKLPDNFPEELKTLNLGEPSTAEKIEHSNLEAIEIKQEELRNSPSYPRTRSQRKRVRDETEEEEDRIRNRKKKKRKLV